MVGFSYRNLLRFRVLSAGGFGNLERAAKRKACHHRQCTQWGEAKHVFSIVKWIFTSSASVCDWKVSEGSRACEISALDSAHVIVHVSNETRPKCLLSLPHPILPFDRPNSVLPFALVTGTHYDAADVAPKLPRGAKSPWPGIGENETQPQPGISAKLDLWIKSGLFQVPTVVQLLGEGTRNLR